MIVRANVHASHPSQLPDIGLISGLIAGVRVGTHRQNRATRHSRIRRLLSTLDGLDTILPGISRLAPGPANDLLRSYRFSEAQLDLDPEDLRAALVAARVLCWLKLHR